MPGLDAEGGVGSRLGDLARTPYWPATVARLRPVAAPADVPDRLDALVDAAVTYYGRWAHGNPVMLVHAATAPRAARLVLPGLPEQLWVPTFEAAWAVTAAIGTMYRPPGSPPVSTNAEHAPSPDQVIERAIDTADEHAIKFAEVVQESHRRGNPDALPAGARANRLIAATDG